MVFPTKLEVESKQPWKQQCKREQLIYHGKAMQKGATDLHQHLSPHELVTKVTAQERRMSRGK